MLIDGNKERIMMMMMENESSYYTMKSILQIGIPDDLYYLRIDAVQKRQYYLSRFLLIIAI